MKRCEGPDCENDFEPKRSTARFCSTTCRSRSARASKAAAESVEADAAAGKAEHQLVRAVRRELEQAQAQDTVEGQLALQLARRVANPEEPGVSALSKELRSLLSEAKTKAAAAEPKTAAGPVPEPVEDEVEAARRRREEKAAAARAAAAAGPAKKPARKRSPKK